MTRISSPVFLSVVFVLCVVWIPLTSQAQEGVDATAITSGKDAGVEAVYCFNVSLPSMDQTGVVYVTYLVTKGDWAAHMDWNPGFINGMFNPPLVSTLIHVTDAGANFSSPYMNQHTEFVFGDRNARSPYGSQSYRFTELVHCFDENKAWQFPETVDHQIAARDPNRIEFVEIPYNVRNRSGEFDCHVRVNGMLGKITQLQQSPRLDWERSHSGFQEFKTRDGVQQAASECLISDLGDRFQTFNELGKGIQGDHPQHSENGLLFHRGGRHVRTAWKQTSDVVVPENITVTLGPTGDGMLLRSARLLSMKVVPETEIHSRIEKLRGRTSADIELANLNKAVGNQFWKVSPQQLDAGMKTSAERFKEEYQSLLAQPLIAGDRAGALRGRVLIFAATTEAPNIAEFQQVLTEFVDFLGESAGPEGQIALLFDLLEMLRFWERPDLELVATQEVTRIMELQPPDRQIRLLFYVRGATETGDIYVNQFLNAISRSLKADDVPETLIRGGLVVASTNLQSVCSNVLADSSNRIKDPVRRTQIRSQLFTAYSRLLDDLQGTKSAELQQTSVRLRRLVEILEAAGKAVLNAEGKK